MAESSAENSNPSSNIISSNPGEQLMEVEDEGLKITVREELEEEEEKQPSMPQITFTRLQQAYSQRKNEI